MQLALGRRALSDEFFCAFDLASIAALLRYVRTQRAAWLVAWTAAATIAFAAKEAFLLAYPVILLFWWVRSRNIGWREIAAWAASPFLFFAGYVVLARDVASFFRIARIITTSMTAPYAAQYQSGPPHRVLIDMIAIAPIVTIIALAALVMSAVRSNGTESRHLALLLVNAIVELKLFYDIFVVAQVYDPVTDNLLRALKMLPR